MSLSDRLFGRDSSSSSDSDSSDSADVVDDEHTEQLAPADGSELEPKGERRVSSGSGFFASYVGSVFGRDEQSRTSTRVGADASVAPAKLDERYREYVQTKPLVKSPLSVFSDAVVEPGWTVSAEVDGETDDDMEEALELWGKNCVIHSQEPGNDILTLVEQIPEKRRGKGTMFVEKVGTRDGSTNLGALMLLDPSTIKTYARKDQPILIQPDDEVEPDHPTTDDGGAAAYTQYESDDLFPESETIAFSSDELVKIEYDPDEGDAWGTPIWVTIREHIDSLYQKLRDRDASIRINGHPWRVISNENWTYDEARRFLEAHFEGDISTWVDAESEKKESFAGRLDAVPESIDVAEHTGSVPDIDDAIMDDVQAIFSVMPVSRFKIAYEEDINQFVVEPQAEKDDRQVDKEQQLIRQHIEPLFQEKADELASGETYDGEVTWKLTQSTDENPLERDSFDAQQFASTAKAFTDAGAPAEVIYWLAGVDSEQFDYAAELEDATLDESDDAVQEAADAMNLLEGDDSDELDDVDDIEQ